MATDLAMHREGRAAGGTRQVDDGPPGPGVQPVRWLIEAYGLAPGDRVRVDDPVRWRDVREGRVTGAIAAKAVVDLAGYGPALVYPWQCAKTEGHRDDNGDGGGDPGGDPGAGR